MVASFGADPAHELSISWRTDPTVAQSRARFRPESLATSTLVEPSPLLFAGIAEPIDSDGLLNDPTILRHKVRATGLRADARYEYAVGDGTEAGWSRWYAARTAPAAPRDYGFLYLGDAQCELERWGELAHAAVKARPDAGFLVLAGDLVDRGNERSNWDHFLLRAAGVFDAIPFMPAVGNHEYLDKGPVIYRKTFDLPQDGPAGMDPNLVYSFEYADAFVAVSTPTRRFTTRRPPNSRPPGSTRSSRGPGRPGSSSPSTTRSTPRTPSGRNRSSARRGARCSTGTTSTWS